MRIQVDGVEIPYPDMVLRARLRLAGLRSLDIETIISSIIADSDKILDEPQIVGKTVSLARNIVSDADVLARIEVVFGFYAKRLGRRTQPIVLLLEGASATGKSLLAVELIQDLAATRVVTTDTVRQVLRTIMDEETYPELFCHTYQAYQRRLAGPEELDPMVRGYLAQTRVVMPYVLDTVERIVREGADAVVEGVHIVPGDATELVPGVIEAVIDPPEDVHRAMFIDKSRSSGLNTVTQDSAERTREWEAARSIQKYLVDVAVQRGVPVIPLRDYDTAINELRGLVIARMRELASLTD
ncbi:MAG: hypothetical protein QXS20_07895 [Candidatus Thorarchaeota archaeon]